jgi:hypothetical protein
MQQRPSRQRLSSNDDVARRDSGFTPNLRGTHGHPWLDDRLWLWLWLWKDYYLVNKLAFDGILR